MVKNIIKRTTIWNGGNLHPCMLAARYINLYYMLSNRMMCLCADRVHVYMSKSF